MSFPGYRLVMEYASDSEGGWWRCYVVAPDGTQSHLWLSEVRWWAIRTGKRLARQHRRKGRWPHEPLEVEL